MMRYEIRGSIKLATLIFVLLCPIHWAAVMASDLKSAVFRPSRTNSLLSFRGGDPFAKSESRSAAQKTSDAQKSTTSMFNDKMVMDRMPSLFSQDEALYDRYAACLAATESLRQIRDAALKENEQGGQKKKIFFSWSGGSSKGPISEEKKRLVSAQYVVQSTMTLKALGLSVSQFNQLGREVSQDPQLKQKVSEQAYLYRLAAKMNMDRVPLIEDPNSEALLKANSRRRIQMFAQSMNEIEQLREEQLEKLTRALHMDSLPSLGFSLSDPKILPLLNPKVRAVYEAFPYQAEEIVRRYGLHSEEFNKMLHETKVNPKFRKEVENIAKTGQKRAR